jgi:hypothetical protein
MKEITINNEIYIKKSESEYQSSPIQILVLNRGWNVIGNVKEKDGKTYITNASIIRRWGTTQGLGELAIKGKLPLTILDKCLDIAVDTANVIFVMNCDQSKW